MLSAGSCCQAGGATGFTEPYGRRRRRQASRVQMEQHRLDPPSWSETATAGQRTAKTYSHTCQSDWTPTANIKVMLLL